ncbi:MAG TPA: hypothetical protein VKV27_15475 [Solirubrobacteraceae bacterium]|nr:hypothetical protein [Solirubrobacteraceae bacterium]
MTDPAVAGPIFVAVERLAALLRIPVLNAGTFLRGSARVLGSLNVLWVIGVAMRSAGDRGDVDLARSEFERDCVYEVDDALGDAVGGPERRPGTPEMDATHTIRSAAR